ncbi:MAG: hypothetical protein GY711_24875 [bacterium]|nr:hypothetical protein [bacterium]
MTPLAEQAGDERDRRGPGRLRGRRDRRDRLHGGAVRDAVEHVAQDTGGVVDHDLRRVAAALDQHGHVACDVLSLDDDVGRELARRGQERFERIVELRYFAELTLPEVARVLGVGRTAAVKEWSQARAWLAMFLEVG